MVDAMRRAVTLLAVADLMLVPAATAKFRVSLTLDPARPRAGSLVRATLRTEAAMAPELAVHLHAVGPWRKRSGQAILLVRLQRIDSHTFVTRVRFPYAGRWHLAVPPPGASPSLERWVVVTRRG